MDFIKNIIDTLSDVRILFTLLTVVFPFIFPPNDWFDAKYYQNSPEKNPRGPSEGSRRSVRGGSWYNDIWYLQAGMRFRLAPDVKLNSLGFRCAKNS